MATRKLKFSDQVRAAIESSGMTRYRISMETGVSQSALSRFVRHKISLSVDRLDPIAELLGMRIEVKPPRKRRQK